MFIINQTLKPEKIPEGKGEELFKGHVAWFTRHFEVGDFLLVGPYTDKKMAGVMISPAESREAMEDILKDDPELFIFPTNQAKTANFSLVQ